MQQNVYKLSSYLTRKKKSSQVLFYSLRKDGQSNASVIYTVIDSELVHYLLLLLNLMS